MSANTGKLSVWSRYDVSYHNLQSRKVSMQIFVVLKESVAHVTDRATVIATLHIGPHECKNRLTVSIWSVSIKFCGIRGISRTCYR